MKRWLPWLVLPLVACGGILAHRSASAALLADTDTAVLLKAVDARHDPLSWFSSDWPLQNHFYRPVSTLVFEFDRRLSGPDPAGYGLTNAVLACACVLLLFWLLRETTRLPWLAGASSLMFGAWTFASEGLAWFGPACWWLAAVALLGIARGGAKKLGTCLGAALTLIFLSALWSPVAPFDFRILTWLPGRTASTMTVFALIAMACHARYERLTALPALAKAPTPFDVPATKGTEVVDPGHVRRAWVWIVGSCFATAMALGSYEQAVMLPVALVGTSVITWMTGRRPLWRIHVIYWALLAAYLAVRSQVLPPGVSGYQQQQFRDGPGVLLVLMDYGLPAWNWLTTVGVALSVGPAVLLTDVPWRYLAWTASNFGAWKAAWRDPLRPFVLGGAALSLVTFLPMAWLQPFGHYHYWPSAFRAVFACTMAAVAFKGLLSAVSPPAVQAPVRLCPAPGSLPRP